MALQHATILRELRVSATLDVTPTTRRLTLTGSQLQEFAVEGGMVAAFASLGFDDHVKVLVPAAGQDRPPLPVQGPDRLEWGSAGGRPVAKDYTPRRFTGAELELDFVLHGEGFAAAWAERARPGDLAWIVGPSRSLLLPQAERWLIAGDETALPAIARLLEEFPVDARASVVIQVPGPASVQELRDLPGVAVTWVHDEESWFAAVVAAELAGEVFCWVAGEAGAVRRARAHLTAAGVPRDLLDLTGYWRR